MPAAPASTAAAEKSAPSNLSPRMPTYSSPARSVRVSIDTPENSPPAAARDDRSGHGGGNPFGRQPNF